MALSALTHANYVAAAGMLLFGACSRADVYAITAPPTDTGGGVGGDTNGGTPGEHPAGTAGDTGAGAAGGAESEAGAAGATAASCSKAVLSSGDHERTVTVNGTERRYLLHVPNSYTGASPAPLVLDFHGIGTTVESELADSPYTDYLDPKGVLLAFPEGQPGPAGRAWNVGPCCVAKVDDVAFARAVVSDIQSVSCVDTQRIYAVGVLTGGGMAHYLGCHAADLFAGVSPAAFDLLTENEADCIPARPITVVTFRGTADTRVPYQGGATSVVPGMPATFLGAQASFERWGAIDGCQGSPSAVDANGCSRYTNCQGGVEVVLCTKQGGREEPGDPAIAWPILERHPL